MKKILKPSANLDLKGNWPVYLDVFFYLASHPEHINCCPFMLVLFFSLFFFFFALPHNKLSRKINK